MSNLADLKRAVKEQASPARAKTNTWFFKTGPGEYGEKDQFIGLTVPEARKIAKDFKGLSLGTFSSCSNQKFTKSAKSRCLS